MTQAFNLAQLANNLNTSGQLDATDGLTGALPIANGGTGQTSASSAINALLPSQSGNSGRFLTTNGSAASWGVVNQKILGVAHQSYHDYLNLGNTYRSATEVTGLRTQLTATSTNSYFLISFNMPVWSNNHSRCAIQVSTNGSTFFQVENTGSGAALNWGSGFYQYPHGGMVYATDGNWLHNIQSWIKYAPSTPHSVTTLYVRCYAWTENSTGNTIINGTGNQSAEHGSVGLSSVIIYEVSN